MLTFVAVVDDHMKVDDHYYHLPLLDQRKVGHLKMRTAEEVFEIVTAGMAVLVDETCLIYRIGLYKCLLSTVWTTRRDE